MHRLPATWKTGIAFVIICVTVTGPANWTAWYAAVSLLLLCGIALSGLPLGFLLKRLVVLSPFVLGVAVVNAFESVDRTRWLNVTVKSGLCLLTVVLISNTTPFNQLLRIMRHMRVPALLITTIALMHRYLFVLNDEAERMRRARLSRTFIGRRRFSWRTLASVVSQLFARASERAERIYDAMCARGWK
jgi:cobalt/nickel transport system permease protein